ncbi:hypothetical protein QUF63_15060 [Anaerolineales bacterium HSG25]|nr:hypothetical protein [Anaerolineales bacterium HSG25]
MHSVCLEFEFLWDDKLLPNKSYVIEFKYVKLKETGLSGAEIRALSEKLVALPTVKAKLNSADSQLSRYRQGLAEIYGDKLRLQSHTVVSVGFDRVVWRVKSEK